MLPDVFHPGREIPAESLKGHRLTDYACHFVSNTLKGITKVQVPWVQNTKPCVTGRANI